MTVATGDSLPTKGRALQPDHGADESEGVAAVILFIDNYDSFVYNLVQYFGQLGADLQVHRNDAITLDAIEAMQPKAILISPGPCSPSEAGISVPLIQRFMGRLPILGICLGHQAIGQAVGAVVRRAVQPMHGKTSLITHDGSGCLQGLPSPLEVCRYHSLAIEPATLPPDWIVTAWSTDGEAMAIRHRAWPVEGLQFHPESIFTQGGMQMIANFLASVDRYHRLPAGQSPAPACER